MTVPKGVEMKFSANRFYFNFLCLTWMLLASTESLGRKNNRRKALGKLCDISLLSRRPQLSMALHSALPLLILITALIYFTPNCWQQVASYLFRNDIGTNKSEKEAHSHSLLRLRIIIKNVSRKVVKCRLLPFSVSLPRLLLFFPFNSTRGAFHFPAFHTNGYWIETRGNVASSWAVSKTKDDAFAPPAFPSILRFNFFIFFPSSHSGLSRSSDWHCASQLCLWRRYCLLLSLWEWPS